MSYIRYALDSVFYVSNKIYIPIPISTTQVVQFNIFSIFLALLIIFLIVFFFSKLFDFGTNILFTGVRDLAVDKIKENRELKKAKSMQYVDRRRKQGQQEFGLRKRKQGKEIYGRRRLQGISENSK